MEHSFDLSNVYNFLKGVNKFYNNFNRKNKEENIIWQEGSSSIADYTIKHKSNLPCLLFIPSLINKSYILDLDEEVSLIRFFAKQGYKVYLFNFAEPLDNELEMGLDDYNKRIVNAISQLFQNEKIITIGYCLGGVFAYNIGHLKNIIGQILIATPVDFSYLRKSFLLDNSLVLKNYTTLIESLNKVPPSMVQLFFSYLDPLRIWQKFCQFSILENQQEIEKFLKVEQWINDGISLSKKLGLEALDIIANNNLEIKKSSTPSLIINGTKDNIVPLSSSSPLYLLLENKKIIVEDLGHIGLIISKIARAKILPKIDKWIKKHII